MSTSVQHCLLAVPNLIFLPPVCHNIRRFTILLGFVVILSVLPTTSPRDEKDLHSKQVNSWALKFGSDIGEASAKASCLTKIIESYAKMNPAISVNWSDPGGTFEDIKTYIENTLNWKMRALETTAEATERAATDNGNEKLEKQAKYLYFNAKKMYDPREPPDSDDDDDEDDDDDDDNGDSKEDYRPIELEHRRTFDWPVNITHSCVHVPTNVYDKAPTIVDGIRWSEEITDVFRNNMAVDHFLSWQYFCSSTGFLRIYPAMKWRNGEKTDMYDCRLTQWFIQAAASPKDIVILLDGSGSMLGLRKEIARNVVLTILDTLTDNDYFTVIRFSADIEYMSPCSEGSMVQANDENIREFKERLSNPETINMANFSNALITAFELLQKFHTSGTGSQCNQAIMLITDGAPDTYEDIFRRFNWPNIPVRVFTYLIGREVTDIQEVNLIACNNRGYYTHVTTLAEVREQVQKYIPVMSRPLVLSGTRTPIWTSVYADISEIRLTDWKWEERERKQIRNLYLREREKQREMDYSENQVMEFTADEENATDLDLLSGGSHPTTPEPEATRRAQKKKIAHLMTTVAIPVFDKRNYTVRVADLLGVVGIDIPIKEIIRTASLFKLGVNGYMFIINNNGHVIYHPDLRTLFQDMLKPFYNSVDISEVELADENDTTNANLIMKLREEMIKRSKNRQTITVRMHFDNLRRVVTRKNLYFYGPIEKTPFSLAIVLPEGYGQHRARGQKQIKIQEEDWMTYFQGNNWRVHPDWVYCETPPKLKEPYISPEDVIRNLLTAIKTRQNFRWRAHSRTPPIYDSMICDKELVQSLVYDANATDVFSNSSKTVKYPADNEEKLVKPFGIVTTFVATRSGLTRFEDYRTEEEKDNSTEKPFYELHTRATDELFYKRAVDYYAINSTAFVFSVPYDAGTRNNSLVTASRAFFLGDGRKKAPVGVVGLQYRHSTFAERFFNITSQCKVSSCEFRCSDEEHACYLLDNNGFVVVSEKHEETGRFFGEIDYTIFDSLVSYGIYNRVKVRDYQAICVEIQPQSGPANFLHTPFSYLKNGILWLWGQLTMLLVQYNLHSWWAGEWVAAMDYSYYNDYGFEDESRYGRSLLNKTKAEPCIKEVELYEVQTTSPKPLKGKLSQCHATQCDKEYIAQPVVQTNLILLVVYNMCPCEPSISTLEPKKVEQKEEEKCYRMKHGLPRKRPDDCTNYHPGEVEIKQCGKGSSTNASTYLQLGVLIFIWFTKYCPV
uniref:Voltage-dependent calcium channel subunit alpha-2/delta-3 n=1 Tax=Hadrurus spadix TaxID=141984 RepID=A0A1W7RAW1_9SCOR